MASRLVIGSVVLIAVGLVLVVVGDPSVRLVTGTATPAGTARTFNFTGGTFPSNFNFTGGTIPGNFTRTIARTSSGTGRVTTQALESLAGIALVAAGLLLEVFSVFVRPRPAAAPPRAEP